MMLGLPGNENQGLGIAVLCLDGWDGRRRLMKYNLATPSISMLPSQGPGGLSVTRSLHYTAGKSKEAQ